MAAAQSQTVKRVAALCLSMILLLPLGGCWDALELNDRGIVSALAFDRAPDQTFTVWASILEPIRFRGESRPLPVRVLTGTGRTVEDAIIRLQEGYIPRLYMGHMQWIVVSERLARAGVLDVIEWLNRSLDRRLAQALVVAEGSIADLVQVASPQAIRSMRVVMDMIATKIGGSTNLGPWLEDLAEAGRDPVSGSFKPRYRNGRLLRKDELDFGGLVLFRHDRMVAKLHPEESVPFLLLNGDLRGGLSREIVTNKDGIERAAVTWTGSVAERHVRLVNGQVRYEVNVTIYGRLSELKGSVQPYDEKQIHRVEELLGEAIAAQMQGVFKQLQSFRVESVGVGQLLHAKYPAYWRQVRGNWIDEGFPKVKLVVNPIVKMDTQGLSRKQSRPAPNNLERFGAKPQE